MSVELNRYVGLTTPPAEAWDTVESGAVRRFVQAVMDPDPVYWDEEYARGTKYGGLVAPPLYALHAFRRPPGTPDPLAAAGDDPDVDGSETALAKATGVTAEYRLPPIEVPQQRFLNGGVEAEFLALAAHGDRLTSTSEYVEVYEREGSKGTMVFAVAETTYESQNGQVLVKVRRTTIRR